MYAFDDINGSNSQSGRLEESASLSAEVAIGENLSSLELLHLHDCLVKGTSCNFAEQR